MNTSRFGILTVIVLLVCSAFVFGEPVAHEASLEQLNAIEGSNFTTCAVAMLWTQERCVRPCRYEPAMDLSYNCTVAKDDYVCGIYESPFDRKDCNWFSYPCPGKTNEYLGPGCDTLAVADKYDYCVTWYTDAYTSTIPGYTCPPEP